MDSVSISILSIWFLIISSLELVCQVSALTNAASGLPRWAPDFEVYDLTEELLLCEALPE